MEKEINYLSVLKNKADRDLIMHKAIIKALEERLKHLYTLTQPNNFELNKALENGTDDYFEIHIDNETGICSFMIRKNIFLSMLQKDMILKHFIKQFESMNIKIKSYNFQIL